MTYLKFSELSHEQQRMVCYGARHHRISIETYLKFMTYLILWEELYGELDQTAHWHCMRRAKHGFPEHFRRLFRPRD